MNCVGGKGELSKSLTCITPYLTELTDAKGHVDFRASQKHREVGELCTEFPFLPAEGPGPPN